MPQAGVRFRVYSPCKVARAVFYRDSLRRSVLQREDDYFLPHLRARVQSSAIAGFEIWIYKLQRARQIP